MKKAPSQLQLLSANVIHRWKTQQGLEDTFRSGRPSQITEEIGLSLNEHLKKDEELSSRELSYIISKRFGVVIAKQVIRAFLRQKLKWTVVRNRFGPMISEVNKVKRKEFALKCLKENAKLALQMDESNRCKALYYSKFALLYKVYILAA